MNNDFPRKGISLSLSFHPFFLIRLAELFWIVDRSGYCWINKLMMMIDNPHPISSMIIKVAV
jgi:hypothetical protein